MSTYFYGSTISSCWRGYGLYSTSETSTTETISLTGGFQCQNWGFAISYVDCTVYVGSTSAATTNNSVSTSTGSYDYVSMASTSATITKTTSSQSVTLKVVTYNHSGYKAGTSTATTTVTVPALASYTITYNANGGSGAPSSQTKYYGVSLTLSTTVPTRTNYNFLGWSTSSTATTATYAAGGTYTANSAATLYAVWELAYIAPTVDSLTAYRSDSSGTADDEGTYLYAYVSATADRTTNTSNNIVTVSFAVTGSSTTTYSYSNSSQTASLAKIISAGLSESVKYTVVATVTDSNGLTASKTATVPVPSYIIDVNSSGEGIGLLSAAPDSGIKLGTDTVGSGTKPVYLSSGTLTASSSTVGSAYIPVYLSSGTLTACTAAWTSQVSNYLYVPGSSSTYAYWRVFRIGTLTICAISGRCTSNAAITNSAGNVYTSGAITMPDYPVTFSEQPAVSVQYTNGDSGARGLAWVSIETGDSSYSPTTNPGPLDFIAHASRTLGHPVVSIIAIGVTS